MIRFGQLWIFIIAVGVGAGCGDNATVQQTRPARPEADLPVPAATPEVVANGASDSPVKSPASNRDIVVIDSTWAELMSFVEQQKGKLVVVDIWSTACEPCMTEFPHLIKLQEQFGKDVVAISFDVDYAGIKNKPPQFYRERVLNFLGEQRENRIHHRMCTTAAEDLFNEIKLDSIPAVYVFGRDGMLLKRFDGSNSAGEGVSYTKQVIPFVGDQIKTTTEK